MKYKHLLVVEDELMVQMFLKDILEDLHVGIIDTADSGEEAVELALQENPDLILMDVRLSGDIDGIEAARRISMVKPIRIVFMTAFDFEDNMKVIGDLKNISYIGKPVDIEDLKKVLEE